VKTFGTSRYHTAVVARSRATIVAGEDDYRAQTDENEDERGGYSECYRAQAGSQGDGDSPSAVRAKVERWRSLNPLRAVLLSGAPTIPAEGIGEFGELFDNHFRWLPIFMKTGPSSS
jgi:hypothetical protein